MKYNPLVQYLPIIQPPKQHMKRMVITMKNTLLPEKLKALRKAHGYNQDYIAEYLGVVRQTYSHYETGKRVPSPDTLFKLALLYQISTDDLMQLSVELDPNVYYDAPAPVDL